MGGLEGMVTAALEPVVSVASVVRGSLDIITEPLPPPPTPPPPTMTSTSCVQDGNTCTCKEGMDFGALEPRVLRA
jgi:hypothetical protein